MSTLWRVLLLIPVSLLAPALLSAETCRPTPEEEMGPFYRQGAPLRSKIGSGYLLSGTVKAAGSCAPVPGPLLEFWQAAADGRYADRYRAAIFTGPDGKYRLETDVPPAYLTHPPHIHIRVRAQGFKTLVTQHLLQPGTKAAVFDLILEDDGK